MELSYEQLFRYCFCHDVCSASARIIVAQQANCKTSSTGRPLKHGSIQRNRFTFVCNGNRNRHLHDVLANGSYEYRRQAGNNPKIGHVAIGNVHKFKELPKVENNAAMEKLV